MGHHRVAGQYTQDDPIKEHMYALSSQASQRLADDRLIDVLGGEHGSIEQAPDRGLRAG